MTERAVAPRLEVYDEYAVTVRIMPNPTSAQVVADALGLLAVAVVFSTLFALAWTAFYMALTLFIRGVS